MVFPDAEEEEAPSTSIRGIAVVLVLYVVSEPEPVHSFWRRFSSINVWWKKRIWGRSVFRIFRKNSTSEWTNSTEWNNSTSEWTNELSISRVSTLLEQGTRKGYSVSSYEEG